MTQIGQGTRSAILNSNFLASRILNLQLTSFKSLLSWRLHGIKNLYLQRKYEGFNYN